MDSALVIIAGIALLAFYNLAFQAVAALKDIVRALDDIRRAIRDDYWAGEGRPPIATTLDRIEKRIPPT